MNLFQLLAAFDKNRFRRGKKEHQRHYVIVIHQLKIGFEIRHRRLPYHIDTLNSSALEVQNYISRTKAI